MEKTNIDRRNFMKKTVATGVGIGVGAQTTRLNAASQGGNTSDKVPRKKLGSTGEDIPILLMGCLQKFDAKYDRKLHRAFQMGVDYLDTAQGYSEGQSHKTLAPFLKQVGRKNVWVTSKVNLRQSPSVEGYESNLETCLKDLETDYLDLFFMHAVQFESQLDPEYIKMGERLRKQGKTRFFGFSCHHGNVPALLNKAARVGGIDAIMLRYNFRQYGDLELNKAIDTAKKAGIGLIAMKTQASIPDDQEDVTNFKSKNFTIHQAKMKSVWADERMDAAVSTMKNLQQLQDNVAASKSSSELAMDEFHQLNRLAAQTAPYYCLGCNEHCESKVKGDL